MVALAEWIQQDETASEEGGSFASTGLSELDTNPKNRVWDFFAESGETRRETESQVVEAHLVVLVVVEYDASVCYKYLYAHGNPVMMVDPSGRKSIRQLALTVFAIKVVSKIARPAIKRFKDSFKKKIVTLHTARHSNPSFSNPNNPSETVEGTYHCYMVARRIKQKSKAVKYEALPASRTELLNSIFGDRNVNIGGFIYREPIRWDHVRDDVTGQVARFSKGQWLFWESLTISSSLAIDEGGNAQSSFNYNLERNNCRHWVKRAKRIAKVVQFLPLK